MKKSYEWFLVVVPHYWGRGSTLSKAVAACQDAAGASRYADFVAAGKGRVFGSDDAGLRIDDFGIVCADDGMVLDELGFDGRLIRECA